MTCMRLMREIVADCFDRCVALCVDPCVGSGVDLCVDQCVDPCIRRHLWKYNGESERL